MDRISDLKEHLESIDGEMEGTEEEVEIAQEFLRELLWALDAAIWEEES